MRKHIAIALFVFAIAMPILGLLYVEINPTLGKYGAIEDALIVFFTFIAGFIILILSLIFGWQTRWLRIIALTVFSLVAVTIIFFMGYFF